MVAIILVVGMELYLIFVALSLNLIIGILLICLWACFTWLLQAVICHLTARILKEDIICI